MAQKRVFVGGLLNLLVPGMGFVYVGRWGRAAVEFIAALLLVVALSLGIYFATPIVSPLLHDLVGDPWSAVILPALALLVYAWVLFSSGAKAVRRYQGNSQPAQRPGGRVLIVLSVLVLVAILAVLVLAGGLKLPGFVPKLMLVTATPPGAMVRQVTVTPQGTRSQAAAATLPPPAAATATASPKPLSSAARTPTASLPYAVVTSDTANVRTGPSTDYPKIGVLRKGDQVAVTGRTKAGGWLAVTLADGKAGWMAAELVKLDVPASGIAVVQNIPKPPTPAATRKPAAPTATLTVDEQIARIAKGQHGTLPQPGDMGGVAAGGEAEVTIVNDTPYVLTVLVGSPSSLSITIAACPSCKTYGTVGPTTCQEEGRPKQVIRLKPGTSQVVAKASDRSVIPFLGTWELKPDTAYLNCFFIVTR